MKSSHLSRTTQPMSKRQNGASDPRASVLNHRAVPLLGEDEQAGHKVGKAQAGARGRD